MPKYDLGEIEKQVITTRKMVSGKRGSDSYDRDMTVAMIRVYTNIVDWLCKLARRQQKKIEQLEKK